MRVLLTGATGFMGSRLREALRQAGHQVVACVRRPPPAAEPGVAYVQTDFTQAHTTAYWLPKLNRVDVAINAVGILKPSGANTFEALHERAPMALFDACRMAGVRRVIQISALGADEAASTGYHLSKRAADRHLLALGIDAVVLQPSLVYGPGGASAAMFDTLATLPVVPLPRAADADEAAVQPVHLDDLVAAVLALVAGARPPARVIPVVGPEAMTLRRYLDELRTQLRVSGRLRMIPMPDRLMRLAARVGAVLPAAAPDADTLRMLERGNTASPARLFSLLGRSPRPPADFVPREHAGALALQARWRWLQPILRAALAALWIVTGLLSLGVYPVADSYALLARTGLPGWAMPPALYGAALLDIALGVATLWRPGRWLWLAQAALIGAYTVIITWKLPEFWLHPYGPILKNVPILALLLLLHQTEKPWNTR